MCKCMCCYIATNVNAFVAMFVAVFVAQEKMMIMEGMKHWEDHTCVRFHSRVNEENYIHFLAGKLG